MAKTQVCTFEDLQTYHGLNKTFVANSISSAAPDVYQVTTDSTVISEITAGVTSPKAGDVVIATNSNNVKSAYQYDAVHGWVACDGNVDADCVIMNKDITLAGEYTQVGNLTKTKNGTATFATAGKSVSAALTEIFSKRLQPGTPTNPSVNSVAFSGYNGDTKLDSYAVEAGTPISKVEASATFEDGAYTYSGTTGSTADSWQVDRVTSVPSGGTDLSATNIAQSDSYSDDAASFVIGDVAGDNVVSSLAYKFTVNYTDGDVAKDNLGDDSSPAKKITAGSANKTSSAFTPFRKYFMYVGTDCTTAIDSAFIRANGTTKSGKAADCDTITELTIPEGTKRIVLAIPVANESTKFLKDVTDVDGMGLSMAENFKYKVMSIEGANGYTGVNYNVFVCENANGISATRYTFTIAGKGDTLILPATV